MPHCDLECSQKGSKDHAQITKESKPAVTYSLPGGREAGAQQPEAESKGPLQSRPQRLHLLPSLVGHQSLAKSS